MKYTKTEDIKVRLGENVKKIRKERKLSQVELAELCSVKQHYISNIENGKRNITVDALEKIAKFLNVNPEQLVK